MPSSFREEKNSKFSFSVSMFKLVNPRAGPILTPGASFQQTWWRSIRRCYIPNIKALGLLFSEKGIFKDAVLFSFCLPWQPELWVEFKSLNDSCRASPKEHPCQGSSRLAQWFQRCLKKLLADEGRQTVDDGHRTKGNHNKSL